MKLNFTQVTLVGTGRWYCNFCKVTVGKATPHCHTCHKHHPVHLDCNGKSLVPPPIDYMALFYKGSDGTWQEVGVA